MPAKIKDIMCATPTWLPTTATIQEAAQKMSELDCGFIPVGDKDKIVGIVTDRDIATRATAKNLPASTPVSEIMSSEKVLYCYETDTTSEVASNMAENQVRRLIVLDSSSSKKLTGIVSVCDIVTASKTEATTCHQLIKGVSTSSSATGKSKAA